MTTTAEATTNPKAVRYQKLKTEIHMRVVQTLDLTQLPLWKPEQVRREVRSLTETLVGSSSRELLSEIDRERLVDEVIAEAFGLGPLEPLLKDETITDILVNGPYEVYIERNGLLERTEIVFANNAHLMHLMQRVAARIGRRIDEFTPMVDARLEDGSRIHAIIPPVSLKGPVLSIRRFRQRLTADQLVELETMPREVLSFLRAAVEGRISVLISGGTGSGKTTLLNILSQYIPDDERLVTIEESAELQLQQPHVISLETRPANVEGQGEIKQRDLVRNALRMRPDRIVVGEVRGGEALDMLQAMNTGHEGSMTTIHANDTLDSLGRLEMMVLLAGFELPIPVIRSYIASSITLVIQLARLKGGSRKIMRVSEIQGVEAGGYQLQEIFGFEQLGIARGAVYGQFYATGNLPRCLNRLRASGLNIPDDLFARRVLEPALSLNDDTSAESVL
jgi:pilus assembly protein CpaF